MNFALLAVLVLGHAAVDLNQGALPALLPTLKENLDLSYAESAAILMTMTFSSSIIQPLFGYLSDRWSLNWMLPVGVVIAGVFFGMLAFVDTYWQTLLVVFISGLGVAAYHPEGAKEALLCSPRRVVNMSWFMLGGNVGNGFGPIAVMACYTLLGNTGIVLFAVPAIIVGMAVQIIMRRVTRVDKLTPAQRTKPLPMGERFKPMAFLLTSVIFRASIQMGFMVFMPFYVTRYLGWNNLDAAALLTYYLVVGSIGTIVGGFIGQKMGPRRFFLISVLFVTPFTAFFLMTESGFFFYLWLALSGATLMSTWSSMLVMAQDIMPDRSGMAAALMVGFSIGSGGLCATLMGFLADIWGVMAVMVLMVFLPLLSALTGYFSKPAERPVV